MPKRYGFFGKEETVEEHCQWMAQSYQKKFGSVAALSSENFLNNPNDDDDMTTTTTTANTAPTTTTTRGRKYSGAILVDCRTQPERSVSIIEGAISLEEFVNQEETIPKDKPVITYCTIGYRSSMEAQYIQDRFERDNVLSLDGIVAYTHALENKKQQQQQQQKGDDMAKAAAAIPKIVDPATGVATTNVHTFSTMWGFVQETYTAQAFGMVSTLVRVLQVGMKLCQRTMQHMAMFPSRKTTTTSAPKRD